MSNILPGLIERFFTQRLMRQRNASYHTVAAYRDTFRPLLKFAHAGTGKPPSALDLGDLDADLIVAFLDHILLSSALRERLYSGGVDRQTRGMQGASDHAPVWVVLRDESSHRRAPLRQAVGQRVKPTETSPPKTPRSTHLTGDRIGARRRAASPDKPAHSDRPLLVIDGDSFAHRSYHALPKTIRRSDGKAAGAILGFANFVLRLYADEQPRAVIVGWDSLETPTKRHEMFPAYQSGRELDDDLIEQLNVLPELVAAFGFENAKAAGYEADLAASVAAEERAGGSAVVASGDRDSFQLASPRTTILYPSRGGEIARLVDVSIANASENLPIVSEAKTKNSCFAPECAFGPLHRLGDLRDWCSGLRMCFEFLDVFLRPWTTMRCRLLCRHEQSP